MPLVVMAAAISSRSRGKQTWIYFTNFSTEWIPDEHNFITTKAKRVKRYFSTLINSDNKNISFVNIVLYTKFIQTIERIIKNTDNYCFKLQKYCFLAKVLKRMHWVLTATYQPNSGRRLSHLHLKGVPLLKETLVLS